MKEPMMSALATLPSSKALDFEKMREIYTTFATNNPNFSAIVFVDKDGFAKWIRTH
ncbi:hypothetical protein KHA80_05245 [Anaerobacillus sp. HL2]|nr:hypothetical protein KHA80_05245 [Anaerobacillus sp. HL2]